MTAVGLLAFAVVPPGRRAPQRPKLPAAGSKPPAPPPGSKPAAPHRDPEARMVAALRVVAGFGLVVGLLALLGSLILGQARDPSFRLDVTLVGLLLAALLAIIFGPGKPGGGTGGGILGRWTR